MRRLAEAPGSRTQPPRVSGERPILKTGRATGPRSLPRRISIVDGGLRGVGLRAAPRSRNPQAANPQSEWDQPSISRTSPARGPFCESSGVNSTRWPFAQQLEHRAADRAAVEEVLDPAFVADEPEAFVDEEPCDCPGWHTPSPPFRTPREYPKGTQPVTGACEGSQAVGTRGRPSLSSLAELENRGQSRQFSTGSQAEADL